MPFGYKRFCNGAEQRSIIGAKSKRRASFAEWIFTGNLLFLALGMVIANASAADSAFLGQQACSSSGCHGGAAAHQNQSLTWSRLDPHARAAATLTSARSKRLAQVLKIADATKARDCTACHAPLHGLPADLLPANVNAAHKFDVYREAISCESCHGPARNWIRSHTRADLTREQKAIDGLRDLTIFYNRANSCVACHQVLEPKLLAAGHPELIFELDGQSTAMPRHWTEKDQQYRLKGWATGQAVALRELTAQIISQAKTNSVAAPTLNQWQSVLWIVSRAFPTNELANVAKDLLQIEANSFTTANSTSLLDQFSRLHRASDALAVQMSLWSPNSADGLQLLKRLAHTYSEFAMPHKGDPALAKRADRLVLALDRLAHTLEKATRQSAENELASLFELVQSQPDFDGAKFADSLRRLSELLEK